MGGPAYNVKHTYAYSNYPYVIKDPTYNTDTYVCYQGGNSLAQVYLS